MWEKGGNFYGLHRRKQGTHHVFFQWLLQSRHTLCRYQRMARQVLIVGDIEVVNIPAGSNRFMNFHFLFAGWIYFRLEAL